MILSPYLEEKRFPFTESHENTNGNYKWSPGFFHARPCGPAQTRQDVEATPPAVVHVDDRHVAAQVDDVQTRGPRNVACYEFYLAVAADDRPLARARALSAQS